MKVGTSGICGTRLALEIASTLARAAFIELERRSHFQKHQVDMAGDHVVDGLRGPLVGHVDELRPGQPIE
jgi:hypothetical protein